MTAAAEVARTPAGLFEWQAAFRDTPGVALTTRAVLMTLATYATTETGEDIRPSLSRLAETIGAHRSTLTKHVASGLAMGWLELVEDNSRDGRPSVYRLTTPKGGAAQGRQGVPPTVRRGAAHGRQGVPPSVRTTSTETYTGTASAVPTQTDAVWQEALRELYSGDGVRVVD